MTGYPSDRLLEEVAFVAYYFHWPYEQIMSMDHRERQAWVTEVAKVNERLNENGGGS
jgi:transposase